MQRKLTDPAGRSYLLRAARSGSVEWPSMAAQGLVGLAVQSSATWLANRLLFRGGWTVVVWQGDEIAPKRRIVVKRRYRTQALATAALEALAVEIARSGLRADGGT